MAVPFKLSKQRFLWKDHPVDLKDFAEVREYVDACLNPANAPEGLLEYLTMDFEGLLNLVHELDSKIPWPTEKERQVALETVHRPPVEPRLSGAKARSKIDKKKLKHRLKSYEAKLREWKIAYPDYEEQLPEFEARHRLFLDLKMRCAQHFKSKKIVHRLLRELKKVIEDGGLIRYGKVPWQMLPHGEPIATTVDRYLRTTHARDPRRKFDSTRIKRVITLSPDKAYVGRDEFDGYVVFLFSNSRYAVLECPWVGNALYLLEGNWLELSRLPKTTLLSQHRRHASRIIHDDRGNWFNDLKRILNTSRPRRIS